MGSSLSQGRPDPQLKRHIDEQYPTLDELVRAAERASALMAHDGWPVLLTLLEAEVSTIDAQLDSGRPLESRAHYAAAHGRRGGLRAPEAALQALVGRAETRLAEQRAKHESGAESPQGSST